MWRASCPCTNNISDALQSKAWSIQAVISIYGTVEQQMQRTWEGNAKALDVFGFRIECGRHHKRHAILIDKEELHPRKPHSNSIFSASFCFRCWVGRPCCSTCKRSPRFLHSIPHLCLDVVGLMHTAPGLLKTRKFYTWRQSGRCGFKQGVHGVVVYMQLKRKGKVIRCLHICKKLGMVSNQLGKVRSVLLRHLNSLASSREWNISTAEREDSKCEHAAASMK